MRVIFVIILGLALAVIMIGIDNAYGETFEDYITIQIPDNVKQTEIRKQITHMDATTFEFQITYRFTADEVKKWYEENVKKYEFTQPECEFGYDEKTEQCLNEIIILESNFIPQKKPKDLIQYEKDSKKFETKLPTTKDELDYSNQIKVEYLKECYRGIDQMRGITEESSFYTSEFNVDTSVPRAGHITGYAGQLDLAIEECDAIRDYLKPTLGIDREPYDIRSRQSWFGEKQVYHADLAHYDKEVWFYIPTQKDFKLNIHDFVIENTTAFDRMCASDKVTDIYKKQEGCPPPFEVGLLLDGTCRYGTVYNDDKTACIPIPAIKRTNGGIPINSYVWDAYERYDRLGDAEQFKQIQDKLKMDQERHRLEILEAFNGK